MLFRNAASWRTREYENRAVFRNVMSPCEGGDGAVLPGGTRQVTLGGSSVTRAVLEDVAGNDMGCFRDA